MPKKYRHDINMKLVDESRIQELWTRQKTANGKETPYGLGWEIDPGPPPTISHGGGDWGTSTFIIMAAEQRAGVVVLVNLNGDHLASDLAPELMKIVLDLR